MHRIELFLPADSRFSGKRRALANELSRQFGGLTAFTRTPVKGLFEQNGTKVEDDVVVFEIITARLEKEWWGALRVRLEDDFRQDDIVIRATAIERL